MLSSHMWSNWRIW